MAEAARSTGLHAERLRSLARRGSIQSRRGNLGLEVLVAEGRPVYTRSTGDRSRPSGRPFGRPTTTEGSADRQDEITTLTAALARAEGENRVLREALEQATVAAEVVTTLKVEVARLEAELQAGKQAAQEAAAFTREALDRERALVEEHKARADRLEAELRRPWWRKLLG